MAEALTPLYEDSYDRSKNQDWTKAANSAKIPEELRKEYDLAISAHQANVTAAGKDPEIANNARLAYNNLRIRLYEVVLAGGKVATAKKTAKLEKKLVNWRKQAAYDEEEEEETKNEPSSSSGPSVGKLNSNFGKIENETKRDEEKEESIPLIDLQNLVSAVNEEAYLSSTGTSEKNLEFPIDRKGGWFTDDDNSRFDPRFIILIGENKGMNAEEISKKLREAHAVAVKLKREKKESKEAQAALQKFGELYFAHIAIPGRVFLKNVDAAQAEPDLHERKRLLDELETANSYYGKDAKVESEVTDVQTIYINNKPSGKDESALASAANVVIKIAANSVLTEEKFYQAVAKVDKYKQKFSDVKLENKELIAYIKELEGKQENLEPVLRYLLGRATDTVNPPANVGELEDESEHVRQCVENAKADAHRVNAIRDEIVGHQIQLQGSVRVFCRIRPLNKDPKSYDDSSINPHTTVVNDHTVQVAGDDPEEEEKKQSKKKKEEKKKGKKYTFERVFRPTDNTAFLFQYVKYTADAVKRGVNSAVFAYGQTGSGKSFTMQQDTGLYRLFYDYFRQGNPEYEIRISIVQVFPSGRGGAKSTARQDMISGEWLKDGVSPTTDDELLSDRDSVELWDEKQLATILDTAVKNRLSAATSQNPESSRSHLVIRFHLYYPDDPRKNAHLALVDLAGNEASDMFTVEDLTKADRRKPAEVKAEKELKQLIEAQRVGITKSLMLLNTYVRTYGQTPPLAGGRFVSGDDPENALVQELTCSLQPTSKIAYLIHGNPFYNKKDLPVLDVNRVSAIRSFLLNKEIQTEAAGIVSAKEAISLKSLITDGQNEYAVNYASRFPVAATDILRGAPMRSKNFGKYANNKAIKAASAVVSKLITDAASQRMLIDQIRDRLIKECRGPGNVKKQAIKMMREANNPQNDIDQAIHGWKKVPMVRGIAAWLRDIHYSAQAELEIAEIDKVKYPKEEIARLTAVAKLTSDELLDLMKDNKRSVALLGMPSSFMRMEQIRFINAEVEKDKEKARLVSEITRLHGFLIDYGNGNISNEMPYKTMLSDPELSAEYKELMNWKKQKGNDEKIHHERLTNFLTAVGVDFAYQKQENLNATVILDDDDDDDEEEEEEEDKPAVIRKRQANAIRALDSAVADVNDKIKDQDWKDLVLEQFRKQPLFKKQNFDNGTDFAHIVLTHLKAYQRVYSAIFPDVPYEDVFRNEAVGKETAIDAGELGKVKLMVRKANWYDELEKGIPAGKDAAADAEKQAIEGLTSVVKSGNTVLEKALVVFRHISPRVVSKPPDEIGKNFQTYLAWIFKQLKGLDKELDKDDESVLAVLENRKPQPAKSRFSRLTSAFTSAASSIASLVVGSDDKTDGDRTAGAKLSKELVDATKSNEFMVNLYSFVRQLRDLQYTPTTMKIETISDMQQFFVACNQSAKLFHQSLLVWAKQLATLNYVDPKDVNFDRQGGAWLFFKEFTPKAIIFNNNIYAHANTLNKLDGVVVKDLTTATEVDDFFKEFIKRFPTKLLMDITQTYTKLFDPKGLTPDKLRSVFLELHDVIANVPIFLKKDAKVELRKRVWAKLVQYIPDIGPIMTLQPVKLNDLKHTVDGFVLKAILAEWQTYASK